MLCCEGVVVGYVRGRCCAVEVVVKLGVVVVIFIIVYNRAVRPQVSGGCTENCNFLLCI